MQGDVTFSPRTDLATLYTRTCSGDARLNVVHTVAATPGDLRDPIAGTPGTLRLYQLDCACSRGIALNKNTGLGVLSLSFL